MKIIDCIQGQPEWHAARRGRIGASSIADATAKTRTGWGASRANLAARLVVERLTGTTADSFTNDAMRWGTEQEPAAREMYAFASAAEVKQIGLVLHPAISMSHASPDGLVGDDGLVEIKCPSSAVHIETLLGAPIDGKYVKQMAWQMACTGRAWCDFVSFDPRMPAEMQLHVQRVHRDDKMISDLEAQVVEFLAEVAATVDQLTAKFMREAA